MAARGYVAGGTIRVSRFVKVSTAADHTVLEADANEVPFGISQAGGRTAPIPDVTADPAEAAQSGEHLDVHQEGEEVLLRAGTGGWTRGDRLKSDADGQGIPIATTGTTIQHIGAVAMESASAGELGRVRVQISSERPALA